MAFGGIYGKALTGRSRLPPDGENPLGRGRPGGRCGSENAAMERVQHIGGTTVMPQNSNRDIETTRVPNDQLKAYFDKFTKHFLVRESTNAVDVEVLSMDWGDQFAAEGAHLYGIAYDPRANALEFELEGGDHRIQKPKEVWTAEDFDGFVKAIEVVRDDGTREVAKVSRLGVAPAPPPATNQPRRDQ